MRIKHECGTEASREKLQLGSNPAAGLGIKHHFIVAVFRQEIENSDINLRTHRKSSDASWSIWMLYDSVNSTEEKHQVHA